MSNSNIRIRWNDQTHLIPYYQIQQMTFKDLVKQIKDAFKDIPLLLYDLLLEEEGQHILHDDQSLRQAMDKTKKKVEHDISDIILIPKHDGRSTLQNNRHIPVIKPMVLRWDDDNNRQNYQSSLYQLKRRHISSTIDDQDDYDHYNGGGRCLRKDSGVLLDEPVKKKPRVLESIERSFSASPCMNAIYPQEKCHRPSTAPSSPINIRLPALSSITSPPPLHLQLAPLQPSPQRQQYLVSLPSLSSPRFTPPCTNQLSGQFVCEQVVGPGRICGQTFRRSYDLSRHQTVHSKNRPFYYCHQCGKRFTRMDALRRHERVQGHSTSHRQQHQQQQHQQHQTWTPYQSPSTTPSIIHSRQARV
ncbi:hypothetical protein BC941DRAFT_466646 [Chlamydoabsidia padenii]|nr:hypothetical protein BC941DRAFT_466646 [Chlamydoabsidia padenii]